MSRGSAGFAKLEIPLIQGLTFDNEEDKSPTSKSKILKQLKDGFDLKFKNEAKTKEEEPSTHEEKYRNSINKSIEMLEFMKNIDSSSFKKERPRTFTRTVKRIQGFTFGHVLGKGKFGEVYLARHIETGFIVAIKKVAKDKLREFRMIDQFIKEIKLHNSLDHPKIVKFYGFFEEKESIYLVIEYMNGGTLFDYLNLVGTLNIKEAIEFLRDVLEGLTYMHERSIAHRDIKPENIVISSEGVAKLCDFGWAALVDNVRQTYCGTLDYASPEILERKQYDISVDMWSIGVLTY
jgi:thiamine kinase-like enzyme